MINERNVKKYCIDYQLIENYQQAVNDETQSWDCHHRREISENKSKKQLKDEGLYYDVNPDELIFLTHSEHSKLHQKGKQHSEETKLKLSESHNGERNPMFGKQHSEETKLKLSESHNGKPVMCIETAEVFESLTEAARKYNLFSGPISECCNGKRKSCGKLHWKFVE